MERLWMTLDQIKAEYASNDYNPELLLQHLLHHVEASPASVPEGLTLNAIHAAWHGAGVDIAGGNWKRFVVMLSAAPTPPVSEDRKDAERFRFMLDDPTRQRVRELFERLPVMSLSAARAAIDALRGE